jgi:hypothetical protein
MSVPLEIHIWVLEFVEVHMLQLQRVSVIQDLQNQGVIVIRIRLLVVRPFVEQLVDQRMDASLEL